MWCCTTAEPIRWLLIGWVTFYTPLSEAALLGQSWILLLLHILWNQISAETLPYKQYFHFTINNESHHLKNKASTDNSEVHEFHMRVNEPLITISPPLIDKNNINTSLEDITTVRRIFPWYFHIVQQYRCTKYANTMRSPWRITQQPVRWNLMMRECARGWWQWGRVSCNHWLPGTQEALLFISHT